MVMKNKRVNENFRDFINSAELGGSGNRYEFGRNPEDSSETVKEMLGFINDISNTALNVIENNNLSNADLDEMVYVKNQIKKARKELSEGYLKLQDTVRRNK